MPYLHWQTELKAKSEYSFESANWNMPDLFEDYFKRRWRMECAKLRQAEKNHTSYPDFLYAPVSAKKKCTQLAGNGRNLIRSNGGASNQTGV